MKKGEMTIDIKYDDNMRLLIANDAITALRGNAEGTTIYFHGNSVTVRNPIDEIVQLINNPTIPTAVSSQLNSVAVSADEK